MDKRFWAIIGVLLIIVVGAILVSNNKNNSNKATSNVAPTNHVEGKGSSGVKLMEYGDYECPICEMYYPVVKQVQAQFNDQIYFQFRNLPLTSIHQNAFVGARAAEAAAMQNKFWQMHDALYENQNSWAQSSDPSTAFTQYAKQLGLNVSKFQQDESSDYVNNVINADMSAFSKTNQQEATPTFFIDGKYVSNSKLVDSSGQPSAQKFAAVVANEIASKQQSKK
jgi:protein-disulfide isomerase